MKRDQLTETKSGKQTGKARIQYFDFENEWRIKTSTNNEFSFLSEQDTTKFFENEIQVPDYNLLPHEALDFLSQEEFNEDFAIKSLKLSSLPANLR